jgi:hypothetical protein
MRRPTSVLLRLVSGCVAVAAALVLVAGATTLFGSNRSVTGKSPDGATPLARVPSGQPLPQRLYGRYANHLPTSASFFPIAVFDEPPAGGDVPRPRADQAFAFKAMGVNVFVGLDGWPSSYGRDTGRELAAACAAKMYFIGSYQVGTTQSGAPNSIRSVLAAARSRPRCAKYLVGYSLGDEPSCGTDVAAQVSAAAAVDPTRMDYEGTAGFYPQERNPGCLANLNAPSIAAADDYAITNPWDPNCLRANAASDCLWEYGAETRNVIADDTSGHPVWMVVESGTDGIRFSSQNGSVCNPTTNLCSRGNEDRATPVQVNSAAWLTLINGANGLEWFCDDSVSAPDACAGGGRNGHAAACSFTCRIPANLSYIDHAVESFARELNVASASRPTVRSSNARVPIDTMVKVVNGVTYLFAESDRNGSTTGSFELGRGLAGATAKVVYDSDARYDRPYSERNMKFTLGSNGSFRDGFGAHGDNYQVKIYKITK